MPRPVLFLSETLAAMTALVRPPAIMHPLVNLQPRRGVECFWTQTAFEVPDIFMKVANMITQGAAARVAYVLGQAQIRM